MRRWIGVVVRVVVVAAVAATLGGPLPVSAADAVATFDDVTVTANPSGWRLETIARSADGSTGGTNYARVYTGQGPATGLVIDYRYTVPKAQVTLLRLFNNGGGVLTDGDGIGTAQVEIFDAAGTSLWSGPLVAGNGGAPFDTVFPTALDGVARVRLSEITALSAVGAPDILWRELRMIQHVSTPSLRTVIAGDGFSDVVTVSGTEGLAGTLDWTLSGPVDAGAGGTCAGATWAGAPVVEAGTVAIAGDGIVTTSPSSPPTAGGCYSYGDALTGASYTAAALSPVGQPAETFARPVTATVSTVIAADGFSDVITVAGTRGFASSVQWALLGPVDAGPSGTCADADFAGAAPEAGGTVTLIGDGTLTASPTTAPSTSGCHSYEAVLTGASVATVASPRGQPAETFATPSTPTITTTAGPGGATDEIVVDATAGFAGTLRWTLHGPAAPGPGGTCADADLAGAVVLDSGAIAVLGDGTYTAVPSTEPTDAGCYSYAATLSGPSFTADAISPVGQPAETVLVPPTTTSTTTTTTTPGSTTTTSDPAPGSSTSTTAGPTSTIAPTTTTSAPDPCAAPPPTIAAPATSSTAAPPTTAMAMAMATAPAFSTTTADPSSSVASTAATTTDVATSIAPLSSGASGFARRVGQAAPPCPTTTTSVVPRQTSVGGRGATAGGSARGQLPHTGGATSLAGVAALLVLVGAGCLMVARPRR